LGINFPIRARVMVAVRENLKCEIRKGQPYVKEIKHVSV